jgi:hypothetical protein
MNRIQELRLLHLVENVARVVRNRSTDAGRRDEMNLLDDVIEQVMSLREEVGRDETAG